ncbi:MAG TPA: methylated-DNA--[protein]-cysteine S-methyltransferase [Holophaga sp.]|nr:methylated-DNA--[protein]-cysteine S-methyltransferase [Holophaga sp.]
MSLRLVESPLGPLALACDRQGAIRYLGFADHEPRTRLLAGILAEPDLGRDPALLDPAARQLEAWFTGRRRAFDLPLAPRGTPFQRRVWEALQAIPYGATATYASLAAALGGPALARAVGAANGANPISIIIPCHRLLGSDGALTGFAGGLERKRLLLAWEASGAVPGK